MAAFKDKKNGSWYVQFRYTDWRGERQQKLKRGFATKKEAQAWEREFLMQKQADINMSFESFVALYEKDVKPKLKLNTWLSKEHIIRTKILPYFKKRKLSEITARDVIDWQNEIRQHTKSSGESYSPDYLKNVHTQLSCIFNHAIKYYGLQINPAAKAGNMGSEQPKEMLFWTKEEYLKFIDAMMDKPMLYYAFEILYWCGIREGELLALTPADFDFEKKTLRINKSYQRLQGKDVITTPKTKKSNRVIQMPDFLCDEIQDYFKELYGLEPDSRIFPLSKYALKRGMEFGCKASGVKIIRIHDLRHSHVSLLINMGYDDVERGERGSSEEHLTVTQFKVQREQARLAELTEQNRQQEQQAATLGKQIKKIQNQQVDVAAIEKIEAKPVPLSSKVILERSEYESLATEAKKYAASEKKESKLQKALDAANRLIAKLKAEIAGLKQELSEYKSVRSKLRTPDLERENAELRGKVQRYENVIQRNNLWHFFRPRREKTAMRDDAR